MATAHVPHLDLMASAAAASASEAPMSRTHQYRKVMKPLLERKRRARINKCLDELKDLMVYALQSEGESIAKLEKADVLELTVKHLQKLKRQRMLQANPALDMDRYRSGFTSCANEVSRCLATIPGVNVAVGTTLMSHLGARISSLDKAAAAASSMVDQENSLPISVNTSNSSNSNNVPLSPVSDDHGYTSSSSPSPRAASTSPPPPPAAAKKMKKDPVWRPF